MQTTYSKRLERALEHAGMSQSELARRIGLSQPQAIQYLADEKNAARGSKHTPRIAQELGIDAVWLATGEGQMLTTKEMREPSRARYDVKPQALAKAIRAMPVELQRALGTIVSALTHQAHQSRARVESLSQGETNSDERLTPKSRRTRTA